MSGKRRPRYVSSSSTDPMQSELEAKVVILGTQREQVSPWLRMYHLHLKKALEKHHSQSDTRVGYLVRTLLLPLSALRSSQSQCAETHDKHS